MFEHFVIKNFRCFAGLHLQQLQRVNLIAGKNNTGKTALLEAIHLHNHPNEVPLPLAINKLRGIQEPGKSFEDVLSWLFYGKHPETGMEVSSWDHKGIVRALSIWLLDAAAMQQRIAEAQQALDPNFHSLILSSGSPRLVLRYEQTNQAPCFSIGVDTSKAAAITGMGFTMARIAWNMPDVYLTSAVPSTELDMKHFGEVEAAKRQEEILPALQILEPRLQKLSLVPLAGESVIHGDLGLARLVPLPFMGEGIRRVLSIVLAIANAPGGVVLIDEVENGLHYSVMKDVWKAIAVAARRIDVQVFATTHSWECVLHAHEAFSEGELYDLRLHRLDRLNGEISAVSYDKEMIETALGTGLEVR